jgi:hypothetical protein
MYDNNVYNLMAQAVEESQSLYKIKNHYLKDAKNRTECFKYWKELEEDKEQHVENLWNL